MNLVQNLRKLKHPNIRNILKVYDVYSISKNFSIIIDTEFSNYIKIVYNTYYENGTTNKLSYEFMLCEEDKENIYLEIKFFKKNNDKFSSKTSLFEINIENLEESLFQNSLEGNLYEVDKLSIKLITEIMDIYLRKEYLEGI